MKKLLVLFIAVIGVMSCTKETIIYSCGDRNEDGIENELDCLGRDGKDGADGTSVTVQVAQLEVGHPACPNGGVSVEFFENGISVGSFVICNGTDGQDGADGANGIDGTSFDPNLLSIATTEATSCANGGTDVQILYDSTVLSTFTICDGENGSDGQDGQDGLDADQFMFIVYDASIIACPNGGYTIEYGIDVNRDGIMDVTIDMFTICNGADGQDGTSVVPSDVFIGTFVKPIGVVTGFQGIEITDATFVGPGTYALTATYRGLCSSSFNFQMIVVQSGDTFSISKPEIALGIWTWNSLSFTNIGLPNEVITVDFTSACNNLDSDGNTETYSGELIRHTPAQKR